MQVLVAGSGLVLKTPDGEIDVRQPFRPVRFAGETPIVSRLEAGPVEVVNLIGHRAKVKIDIVVLDEGRTLRLEPGTHFVYTPHGEATVDGPRRASTQAGEPIMRLRLDVPVRTVLTGRGRCRWSPASSRGPASSVHADCDRRRRRRRRRLWRGVGHVGRDVTFIARGAHLAAMKKRGAARSRARAATPTSMPTQATDDPADGRSGRLSCCSA